MSWDSTKSRMHSESDPKDLKKGFGYIDTSEDNTRETKWNSESIKSCLFT